MGYAYQASLIRKYCQKFLWTENFFN